MPYWQKVVKKHLCKFSKGMSMWRNYGKIAAAKFQSMGAINIINLQNTDDIPSPYHYMVWQLLDV
jgi:hypothetical protein